MRPALRLPQALTALLLASSVGSSWGQLSAEAVKAGLVFNFVKFAEWPAAVVPPGAPLRLCTVGPRDPTIAALDALQDKIAQGHAFSLRATTPREGFKGCHVVVVSAGLNPPLADTVRQAHAAGALTVSDAPASPRRAASSASSPRVITSASISISTAPTKLTSASACRCCALPATCANKR
jgi:hypothetical protein